MIMCYNQWHHIQYFEDWLNLDAFDLYLKSLNIPQTQLKEEFLQSCSNIIVMWYCQEGTAQQTKTFEDWILKKPET